jgi:Zn-dependent protease
MSDPSFAVALRDAVMYMVALVLSICVHEFGHAWVADKLGDPLPRSQGRVTLNPIAHVDPVGTILLPLARFYFTMVGSAIGGFIIGWGKPVMVSLSARHMDRRFSMRTNHLFIAAAGPVMNLLLAVLLSILYVALFHFGSTDFLPPVRQIITMNFGLAFFNLIPCPPLDGGTVLRGITPSSLEPLHEALQKYGLMILFFLLATGMLSKILYPVMLFSQWWMRTLAAIATGA